MRVILIVLSILFAFLGGTACSAAEGILQEALPVFHVSPSGNDQNDGSPEKPFATLEKARDAIRALTAPERENGITVWLHEGRYSVDKTFMLEAEDSGSENARVMYAAHDNAKVVFDSGVPLKASDWTTVTDAAVLARLPEEARGKVLQLDFKDYGFKEFDPLKVSGMAAGMLFGEGIAEKLMPNYELFCNDQPMTPARWPNTGYVTTGELLEGGANVRAWADDFQNRRGYVPPEERDPTVVPVFKYRDARHARWTEAEDPWIMIWPTFFSDLTIPVRSIDAEAGTVTLEYPTGYTLAKSRYDSSDKPYYIYNLLEEIDQPGEWYLNRATGLLYCWPPVPVEKGSFVISKTTVPVFVLHEVSHVTLRGITIANGRAEVAVRVTGGQDVRLEDLTIKNLAGSAMRIEGGTGHQIVNSHILNTGAGGIHLEGGDRPTLTPAGHRIENTEIHDFSRLMKSYAPAIRLEGVGNIVRHNKLHGSEHAVLIWAGNDHLIEYNEIFNAVRTATDMGAIYTGRDITCLGTVIRYNYFHHIGNDNPGHGTQGIFIDDGTSAHHIYGNVFYKAGSDASVKYHGGTRNILENNIFIGKPPSKIVRIQGWGSKFPERLKGNKTIMDRLAEIDPTRPPWSDRWPWLATVTTDTPLPNQTFNNVIVNIASSEAGNFITDEDPGFVDMENGNFLLKADSVVFEKLPDFKPIPFDKIGLLKEGSPEDDAVEAQHALLGTER